MHMSAFLHKACVQFIADHMDHAWNADELEEVLQVDKFTSCIIGFLRTHLEESLMTSSTSATTGDVGAGTQQLTNSA